MGLSFGKIMYGLFGAVPFWTLFGALSAMGGGFVGDYNRKHIHPSDASNIMILYMYIIVPASMFISGIGSLFLVGNDIVQRVYIMGSVNAIIFLSSTYFAKYAVF